MEDDARPETPYAKKFQQVHDALAELRSLTTAHTLSIERHTAQLNRQWAKTARLFTVCIYLQLVTTVGWIAVGLWALLRS